MPCPLRRALYRLAALSLVLALSLGLPAQSSAASLGTPEATGEGQYFRGGLAGSTGVGVGIVVMPNGKYSEYTDELIGKVPGKASD